MKTVTLKSLPDALHDKLRSRAREHGRSLNSEVIACLASVCEAAKVDPRALLVRARVLRQRVRGHVSDHQLAAMKSRGRP